MKSIYLAGPEVFHADAFALGRAKQALCGAVGYVGLYPLDGAIEADATEPRDLARSIYRSNIGMIRAADAVIANLTPFRGPGADVGTVFEVGFAVALGKTVLGYRNVVGSYADRVRIWNGADFGGDADGRPTDRDGLLVEDFGFGDNLMIDAAITVFEHEAAASLTDLSGFTACLKRLQALLPP
ncbi:MAG: nucleoside 2-deoxyribosyltransferase [Zavarzinia sp.]|nr:nucleoside 2-deoxyribosyltransferase [Zavarzinia sp.]